MASLKSLAVETVHRYIISQLLPYTSSGNHVSSANKNTAVKSVTVNLIRSYLDEYLIGGLSELRQTFANNFAEHFNQLFTAGSYYMTERDVKEIFMMFIDCILDKSVKELTIPNLQLHSSYTSFTSLQIINTISHRSPNLETLKWWCEWNSPVISAPSALGDFKNLISLDLNWETSYFCTLDFFTYLGIVCPRLKILNLQFLEFNIPHLLALMFGPKKVLLPSAVKNQILGPENQLHTYQFTPGSLTSVCQSLLKFTSGDWSPYADYCLWGDISAVAFILRHFSQLLYCSSECCHTNCPVQQHGNGIFHHIGPDPSRAIALLNSLSHPEVITTVTKNSLTFGCIQWTENEPFNGSLNLLHLNVNIKSRRVMDAIITLCPQLMHIEFQSYMPTQNDEDDLISPDELQLLLASKKDVWPQIDEMVFNMVSAVYRHTILQSTINDKLSALVFRDCKNIDLSFVALCKQLSKLGIESGCSMAPSVRSRIQADSFLPQLASFWSYLNCLGNWTHLLETHRPKLKLLELNCTHISNISSSVCSMKWYDIPRFWSNLEYLDIFSAGPSLTFTIVRELISQMKQLKSIGLPTCMKQTAQLNQEALNLETELANRNIILWYSDPWSNCPVNQPPST